MHRAVIGNAQSQGAFRDFNPVHLSEANTPTDPGRIVDRNLVLHGLTANRHLERRPAFRNAGIKMQVSASDSQSENALYAGALHPTRRAGVPRPTAPPDMGRARIDVG